MKTHHCHSYDFAYTDAECIEKYQVGLNNPNDETAAGGARCLACDRGKSLYFGQPQEKIMSTNTKKCANGDGKIAVKENLCTKCYRLKHGKAPFLSSGFDKNDASLKGRRGNSEPGASKTGNGKDNPLKSSILTFSVDLDRYPNLHRKLMELGIGKLLDAVEEKAAV